MTASKLSSTLDSLLARLHWAVWVGLSALLLLPFVFSSRYLVYLGTLLVLIASVS